MVKVEVKISTKEYMPDIESETITNEIKNIYKNVDNISVSRVIVLELNETKKSVKEKKTIEEICENLLINDVTEKYEFTIL